MLHDPRKTEQQYRQTDTEQGSRFTFDQCCLVLQFDLNFFSLLYHDTGTIWHRFQSCVLKYASDERFKREIGRVVAAESWLLV